MEDAEQTEAPAEVQDPAPAAPPTLEGPWAKDIQSTFTDPEQQAAVDAFLRQTVQPHVTKLEQAKLPDEAAQLWNDLNENPLEAYAALTNGIFQDQPEMLQAIRGAVEGVDQNAPDNTYDYQEQEQPQQQLPPEVLEATQAYQDQKAEADYDAAHQAVAQADPAAHLDDDHFHSFVVAADGDFEQAAQEWKTSGWPEFIDQKNGTVAPEEVPDLPPNTLPSEGGHSEQPVQQKESLDEAISGWFSEQKDQAPPAVGSV